MALFLTAVALSTGLSLANVSGQTLGSEVVVGTTSNPPSIDGLWQQGEWDSTIAYDLTISSQNQVKNRPSMRLQHDNSTLYGLIDVPSDNGGSHYSGGYSHWGYVLIDFAKLPQGEPHCYVYLGVIVNELNQTIQHTKPPDWLCFGPPANLTTSEHLQEQLKLHSNAGTSLTTTVNSNGTHRVWEFAVQLYPYLTNAPLRGNNSWGIQPEAVDSGGNNMLLVDPGHYATMTFSLTPVPETATVATMLVSALFVTVLFIRERRRYP